MSWVSSRSISHYGEISKFYQAPVQMAANGGVLVIDDFGRQRCSPTELLNRWITPLESRVDYLTLQTGQKLPMPFVVLVFRDQHQAAGPVDEAFLRRIHYKVFAESPTLQQYKEIFQRCCFERDVPYDESLVNQLIAEEYTPRQHPAARLPPARSHRPCPRVRRVPGRAAAPDRHRC